MQVSLYLITVQNSCGWWQYRVKSGTDQKPDSAIANLVEWLANETRWAAYQHFPSMDEDTILHHVATMKGSACQWRVEHVGHAGDDESIPVVAYVGRPGG
jgi:hypothetical protein